MLTAVEDVLALDPKPGFVVKSRILEGKGIGQKVFINICHDPQVPKPSQDFDPLIVFPLIIDNKWEIPHILSTQRETKDKKGVVSLLYDCCMNTTCFQWCQINADLKTIVIEWCIESIELMYLLVLDRETSIPKMLSKGELCKTVIPNSELSESGFQKTLQDLKDNEMLGLVEEFKGFEEEEDPLLPDIMDIGLKGRKPLIEEVSQMKPKANKIREIENSPKIQEVQDKIQEVHIQEFKTTDRPKIQQSSKLNLKFELSFHKTTKFLVKIKFPQLDSSNLLSLLYSLATHSLVIVNKDLNYSFGKSDRLEVPLPGSVRPESSEVACEFVTAEHTLYVIL